MQADAINYLQNHSAQTGLYDLGKLEELGRTIQAQLSQVQATLADLKSERALSSLIIFKSQKSSAIQYSSSAIHRQLELNQKFRPQVTINQSVLSLLSQDISKMLNIKLSVPGDLSLSTSQSQKHIQIKQEQENQQRSNQLSQQKSMVNRPASPRDFVVTQGPSVARSSGLAQVLSTWPEGSQSIISPEFVNQNISPRNTQPVSGVTGSKPNLTMYVPERRQIPLQISPREYVNGTQRKNGVGVSMSQHNSMPKRNVSLMSRVASPANLPRK